ncbi:winged helix-turn-helix domain-containing protein [Kribbella sp. NPDC054772]
MIRVHFTAADLGRVTFPAEPHPLREAALAARALGQPSLSPAVCRWRRSAGPRVRGSMRPLFKLISPGGLFPGFLVPDVTGGLEPAVEALMDTPADVIREQLGPWLPPQIDLYMQGLLAGRSGSRRALGAAVRDFHQHVLAPSELHHHYSADLGRRTRTILHEGVDALLSSLHPDVDWSAPVLTTYSPDDTDHQAADIHLNGRGLELYPSPLAATCSVMHVPDRRPVLIYPCAELPATELATADSLADLLGRTRSAVLRALVHPASTTQLSRRLRISPASVSDHTRVLRAAGLITTERTQGAALHALTSTAHALLVGGPDSCSWQYPQGV